MSRALSRLAAAAVFLGLAALVWLGLAGPLYDRRNTTDAEIATLGVEGARLSDTVASLLAVRDGLTGADTDGMVWNAEEAGQASALVQARLSNLARARGLAFRSVAPLPTRDLPLTQAIGFRLEFDTPLDRLTDFLIAVEGDLPLLVVERATLRRVSRPETPATPQLQPEVFVQIDLVAPVALTSGDDT